jgi:hypothetical protein
MPPVRLTDDELTAVFAAAAPLPIECRDAFLQEVAQSLAACPVIGPGSVYRAAAEVQARYWSPPDLGATRGEQSKYR